MKENFRAVEFLFKKMKNLYSTFQYPDEFGIELWTEILEGYSQTELLDALKEYRKQTVYNKAPNPAEFRKFLEAIKSNDRANMRQRIEKCADEIEDKFGVKARNRYIRGLIDAYGVELKPETEEKKKSEIPNPAVMFMQRDIALGKCRHLLPMYQRAVNYILTDLLSREVPASVWQNMDFGARYSAAMKKGLFNKFDELLVQICKGLTGREYQFQSKNDITNVNFTPSNAVSQVAAHFRANDDDEELGKSIGF